MSANRIKRTELDANAKFDFSALYQLAPFVLEYRGRVIVALLLLLLGKFATVSVPLVLKALIDTLDQGQSPVLLAALGLVAAYALLRFANNGLAELKDALFSRVRYRAMHRLSVAVLEKMHQLSLRWHLTRRTGGLARDIERATGSLSSALNAVVFNIVPTLVELALVIGILLYYFSWLYALVAVIALGLYAAFTLTVTNWRIGHRHEMNRLDSEANGRAIDSLLNFETVKVFNNEQRERDLYDQRLELWVDAAVRTQVSMAWLNFGQAAVVTLGVATMLALATLDVVAGTLSLGDLVMVNAMMLQLFIPLNFLGVSYRALRYAFADMSRVTQLLAQTPEIEDPLDAATLQVDGGAVRFAGVSFAYQADRPILKNINFYVPAGAKVAIVGPSGSGKSTLARLLFRFYDADSGEISIDGQSLKALTQDSLRRAIGVVPQDTVLFNDTLRYNLEYANPNATEAQLQDALRLADLTRFVESLPEGLNTLVGERGLKLSGGEKQRVAIARVVLKSAPILVFDEATSSLDTRSERQINEALQRLAQGTTTLVIAHRLSTIVDADEILVMDEGQIAERGSHDALLQQNGLYAKLWRMQSESS